MTSSEAEQWIERGEQAQEEDDLDKALECFEKALALEADNSEALCYKGLILMQLDRTDAALACIDRCLRVDPEHAGAWYYKSRILAERDQIQEALRCVEESVKLEPDDADSWETKGSCLHSLGRSQEALACFDRALALDAENMAALMQKAVILTEAEERDQAHVVLKRLVHVAPDLAVAWLNLGICQSMLGRIPEALQSLNQALAVATPDDADEVKSARELIRELSR